LDGPAVLGDQLELDRWHLVIRTFTAFLLLLVLEKTVKKHLEIINEALTFIKSEVGMWATS